MPVSSFWFFRIHYLKTVFLCFYSIAVSVAGTFGILCPGVLFIFIRVLFCGYGQLQATLIGHRLRFIKH